MNNDLALTGMWVIGMLIGFAFGYGKGHEHGKIAGRIARGRELRSLEQVKG